MITETLTYSNYSTRSVVKSRIIPGLDIAGPETMRCPRCGTERGEIEHGKTERCRKCQLCMTRYGNALEIEA